MEVDVGVTRHVHAESGIHEVVQRRSAVVPDIELLERGSVGDQELAFGPEVVAGIDVLLPDVDAINKSSLGDEARAVIDVKRLKVELAAVPFQVELVAGSCGTGTGNHVDSRTGHSLALHAPVGVELDVGINTADTVEASRKFAVG